MLQRLKRSIDKRRRAKEPKYYGLNDLDKKMEAYLDYDNGFFVELGANDGINQSNTYRLERTRGWRGVLVEPAPHNYLKCLALRGENNSVFCGACVDFEYSDRFVEMVYSNLMSVSLGMESALDDPMEHIERSKVHLPKSETNFRFGAIARTLDAILTEAGAPERIDFLSLDVEGVEIPVLKGIRHQKYRFNYMLIEHKDFDQLSTYLGQHGYLFEAQLSHHDYLFKDATHVDENPLASGV
ncbi:FkbM family methyltransferase [Ruegeria sp. 2205SS24-7]|uniref:FkbM family methyltransferase n=1 Tax=Ruegeria discodermiae TaxID=3064389 RepID=UPI0027411D53|nr:FkbM family methyltransferase [Ruegeria sp. 2205SS24-7]MDP5216315.1 FkbM family methyltransferase [Ruegeria sp. 2205SS24-7]